MSIAQSVSGFSKTLMPFQMEGALHLANNYHALLADDPGLGKTLQAIAAAQMVGAKRVLVVCPASVRSGWKQELSECISESDAMGWFVISYNEAVFCKQRFFNFDLIILDEGHYLKTVDSKRTQAIFGNKIGLARRARYKWVLSGTPMLSRPVELYPILKCLSSTRLGAYANWDAYTQRYCGSHFDGFGMNVRGAGHLDELAGALKGFMLRRTKEEVLPELPDRIVHHFPLDLMSEEFEQISAVESEIENREEYVSAAVKGQNVSGLGDLAKLLHATGRAKVRAAVDFIADLLETQAKVVVFGWHEDVISSLAQCLRERVVVPVVYGGTDSQKESAKRNFVENPGTQVFLGNYRAAGQGINGLQKVCATVVFAELPWVPGEVNQGIDRVHRIGAMGKAVNAYLLHIPGTVESAMLHVLDRKEWVVGQVVKPTDEAPTVPPSGLGIDFLQ